MSRDLKIFIAKILILGTPVGVLGIVYFISDPFKVLHNYKSYYHSGRFSYTILNRDFVSFETFEKNYPHYKYDSYIFGNSRTLFYRVNDWQKYITSKKCFHFDASKESLWGVFLKFKYLQENNISVKNALLVLDMDLLKNTPADWEGILYMKHPKLSGKSTLSFQLEYLKAFYDKDFFWGYMNYKVFNVNPYSPLYHVWNYDAQYNELSNFYLDSLINNNIDGYYQERSAIFYKRDSIQKYSPIIIGAKQKEMLNYIYNKLKTDKTDFKIIIGPFYDQIKLSKADLKVLQNIFGEENVFDFSGINSITNDCHNYYEFSHYRPHVADYIMGEVYK